MKQVILLFFFFSTNFISSQTVSTDLNFFEKPEFNQAIIYFNDGTSLEGVGRLKTVLTSKEEVIVFKIDKTDADEIWTYKDVNGITIIYEDEIIHYEYLKVNKNSFPELYEVVTEGTIKLFKKRTIKKYLSSSTLPSNNGIETSKGFNLNQKTSETFVNPKEVENTTYYLKKDAEEFPTKVKDNYIKSFVEYMKDCDFLVEDIKNHKYNLGQLKELVDEYNANCGF